jgi:DNA-binding CsgD family transcriptional regulator
MARSFSREHSAPFSAPIVPGGAIGARSRARRLHHLMDAPAAGSRHRLPRKGRSPGEQDLPDLPVMLARALDMLDYALLIVTDERELQYRNRLAASLLAAGHGGLRVVGGALSASAGKLREALDHAISLACAELQPTGLCLPQPGTPPEGWLRLAVAPIYFGGSSRSATCAAVWIVNTGSPSLPSDELLAALFGFSPAEARLARAVLTGCSASEYARHAGVRVATVRSQLHSIFVKTGVRRQAQLVALLSRVPVLQLASRA